MWLIMKMNLHVRVYSRAGFNRRNTVIVSLEHLLVHFIFLNWNKKVVRVTTFYLIFPDIILYCFFKLLTVFLTDYLFGAIVTSIYFIFIFGVIFRSEIYTKRLSKIQRMSTNNFHLNRLERWWLKYVFFLF